MSKIVIKKTVKLDFLGEEYKEAYITFRSIPLSEYDKLMDELPQTSPEMAQLSQRSADGEITQAEQAKLNELMQESGIDNKKSLKMIMDYLKKYFLDGKFPNQQGELEELKAEDLDGLDQEAAMRCFNSFIGKFDPKAQ